MDGQHSGGVGKQSAAIWRRDGEPDGARAVDRTRDHRSEHEEIVNAVLGRDKARAVALLQQHYTRTAQALFENCKELA